MNTRARQIVRAVGVAVALFFCLTGCDKKCQAPPTTPYKTFTGTQWRLVQTTDSRSQFQAAKQYHLLIFKFNDDYTGTVNKVINNTQYDNPVKTFDYNVDVGASEIRVLYKDPSQDQRY